MDRLILGDNQFFGVSHMSEERGMERATRFQHDEAIIAVLDAAYECGIHAFSFSTHDGVRRLCSHFRENAAKYSDLRLYPVLPYAQKYAQAVNEKGVVGAITDVLTADNTAGGFISMLARGSSAALTQSPFQVMKLLVDAEMKMFRDLSVPVIFLQNNVADLMLGFGIKEVFQEFAEHVRGKYNARVGFMTLNMPRMVDFLLECGIEDPVVCSAINKIGFQMNPGRVEYEAALSEKAFSPMAMSVLAAGVLPPKEAFEYVASLEPVQSILFGASTRAHIEQTKALVETIDGA